MVSEKTRLIRKYFSVKTKIGLYMYTDIMEALCYGNNTKAHDFIRAMDDEVHRCGELGNVIIDKVGNDIFN